MRNIPIWSSIVVGLAVSIMVALGIWQLQRAEWKGQLLSTYAAAMGKPAIAWPVVPVAENAPYFRRSSVNCLKVANWRSASGRNDKGQAGIIHIAGCVTGGGEGPGAQVVIGWSERPDNPKWTGGNVQGVIAPDSRHVIRLVANEPQAGLQKAQPPSLDDIPNNHLAYAVQWFFFAIIAIVIFVIAVRRRSVP
jgi:cytochrome oxidase assembly protein ShyY1